jgi:hypothetical protein
MNLPRPRRLLAVLGIVFLLLAAGLVSTPTFAASHSGRLQIKGPGSVYSGTYTYAAEAVGAGSTDQFQLQVVNTGTEVAQYRIHVLHDGPQASSGLYTGSLALTPLAAGPDGYYTAPIAPGKTQSFTLKVVVAAGTPQASINNYVYLNATDGTDLGWVTARTEIKAPTYGTTAIDLFAKQGSQAYVGGSVIGQITSSPATSVGGSAAYTVKLQNDGTVPGPISASISPRSEDCTSVVVKDGTADVTAALLNGTYVTPTLAVHSARTLAVTIKRVGGASCEPLDYVEFLTHDPANTLEREVLLVMPFPAS